MRVVSVLPSATEIVCALGHGRDLVGRSAECDHPPEVRSLPVVMRPRTLDSERPSAEIDRRVRRARERDESLYTLDADRLRELRPDLLLTQDLCGVCSVTSEEVSAACAAAGITPRIVSLMPRTLEEVWATIPRVAEAMGDPEPGHRLETQLRLGSSPGGTSPFPAPRVAVVEWVDPPILAGLWCSEMVRAAGGVTVGPGPGAPGERTTWSDIRRRAPDLLVISPCSFPVPRTLRELADPSVGGAASQVHPLHGSYVVDEAYFSRPGPRLADGIRLVRALLRGVPGSPPMPIARWPPRTSVVTA